MIKTLVKSQLKLKLVILLTSFQHIHEKLINAVFVILLCL
jgi:hypothetical protein